METIKLSVEETAALKTVSRLFDTRVRQEVANLTAVLEDGVGGERDILAAAANLRRTLPARNSAKRLHDRIMKMTRDPRAHVEVTKASNMEKESPTIALVIAHYESGRQDAIDDCNCGRPNNSVDILHAAREIERCDKIIRAARTLERLLAEDEKRAA